MIMNIFFLLLISTSKVITKEAKSARNQKNEKQTNSFVYDQNYKQICNNDNYDLIRPFIDEQWFKARKDLNLSMNSLHKNQTLLKIVHTNYMNKHYRHQAGLFVYYTKKKDLIGYVRTNKCGSESILANLGYYVHANLSMNPKICDCAVLSKRPKYLNFVENLKTQNFDNFSHFITPIDISTSTLRTKHSQFKIFTYIRNPMMKLESGWAESVSRDKNNITEVTLDMFKQWYIDILDYKNLDPIKPIRALDHIYTLSGVLFHYDVNILLAQEKLNENWENIVVPTFNLTLNSFNSTLGFHTSSIQHPLIRKIKNNYNRIKDKKLRKTIMMTQSFRQLFHSIETKDPSLWKAMCRLILIDYVCFPQYQLPASCNSLQKDVDIGRSILRNS